MAGALPRRIAEKVVVTPGGCWLWRATRDRRGYGATKWLGRLCKAHRVIYEILVGPIPGGLELDHTCRRRSCCNPAHMDLATHRENMLRGDTVAAINAAKTHCSNGHEFTDENTYRYPNGSRHCRICRKEWRRRARLRAGIKPRKTPPAASITA